VLGGWAPSNHATRAPEFRAALAAHLEAVAARDFDALLPTLTAGNELTLYASGEGRLARMGSMLRIAGRD
jgi:hypothetical protein